MSLIAGGDLRELTDAGWGVIFADNADPAVEQALQPLLRLRESQAGKRFRAYTGEGGFRAGKDTAADFLARNGTALVTPDPDKVPFYLLLVGDPGAIPYSVQSQLGIFYAVGRLHFDHVADYAAYAANALNAQTPRRARERMVMFGAVHPEDTYTSLANTLLTQPLLKGLTARFPQWSQQLLVGYDATRAGLAELLGSPAAPAVLIGVGHGVAFNPGDPRQAAHQGALLCADWPGPVEWQGAIPPEFYFSADDLSADMNLEGMIALLLASYSAGTAGASADTNPAAPATPAPAEPFVAQLPMRMLGRPRGALAVVGLTDRAWSYTSGQTGEGAETAMLEELLTQLLSGHPIGQALQRFRIRAANLSLSLNELLEEIKFGKSVDPAELAGLWATAGASQSAILLGDPAVRIVTGAAR